jgi:hypothetical protein
LFSEEAEFTRWLSKYATERHVAYVSENGLVVLAPTKSTKPQFFAVYKTKNINAVIDYLKKINIEFYKVYNFDFNDDKALSTEYLLEKSEATTAPSTK